MRLQALAFGTLVVLGAGVPASAVAQEAMPAIEPKREVQIGVRVNAVHDTNIAKSGVFLATRRGIEREDSIFTPALTVSIVQPFGRQALFLTGDAGYDFHRKNPQLDRQRTNLTGGVSTLLGPCRQVTFAGYRASQSELSNLDLGSVENLQQTTSVALGLQCARSVGPGVSVLVQRADTKNSAATLKPSDATTETAALALTYTRPSLGTFTTAFNYSDTEFPNRIIPGRPVGDGFFIQSYSVGYQRKLGSKLTLNGLVARTHVKREFAPPGFRQSFTSNTYALDVLYGLGSRIDIEGHVRREITPSQQVGKTFDKRTAGEALIRYRSGPRLTFTAGYVRQDIDSNADTAQPILVVTNSRLEAVYGAVAYTPNKTVSLQLNVRQEERDANLTEFNYNALRIGLTALANF